MSIRRSSSRASSSIITDDTSSNAGVARGPSRSNVDRAGAGNASSQSHATQLTEQWHLFLRIVSLFNIWIWIILATAQVQRWPNLRVNARQLMLSACYTLGCAFRSFFPRADLQRICIVDSHLSAVFWGRSVATMAELAYAGQLAMFFDLPVIVPVLVVAEVFSWYAILTNRAIFNLLENSLWTLVAALILLFRLSVSFVENLHVVTGAVLFIIFMLTVDLPMYWRRHVADKHYRSVGDGIILLLNDYHPTSLDAHWSEEMAWQAGYFSLFVWSSLFFCVELINFDML